MKLIIIDGNPLLYRGYYAPGTSRLKTERGELSGAFYATLKTFMALQKRFASAHFLFAFDRGLSGRDKIYAGYKPTSGTYTGASKPEGFTKQLLHVQEFLRAMAIPVLTMPNIEADDLISVASQGWIAQGRKFSALIVSSDRDFLQLVSEQILLYDDRAKKFYGPEEVQSKFGVPVNKFLAYKSLIGDTADKIPSVAGFGPVKAQKAVLSGDLPTKGQNGLDFKRNRDLMRLPKTSYAITALTDTLQQKLEQQLVDVYRSFTSGNHRPLHKTLDFSLAQEILNNYECKSLKLEDFSLYAKSLLYDFRRGVGFDD